MSVLPIDEIKKNYERMSDFQIQRIATSNAHGLRPEVIQIIQDEVRKRKLDPKLVEQAIAQNKEFAPAEIESNSRILQNLPCPKCNSQQFKLNGTFAYTVKSFILFTNCRKDIFIACPNCLNQINKKAIISTALLGWWGFPGGIINTPFYIYKNIRQKSFNNNLLPNEALLEFTFQNIDEIDVYKNDKHKLSHIIRPRVI